MVLVWWWLASGLAGPRDRVVEAPPDLESVLAAAGWTLAPERSSTWRAGDLYDGTNWTKVAGREDCFARAPDEGVYQSLEVVQAMRATANVQLGVVRVKGGGMSYKRRTYAEPYLQELPMIGQTLLEVCTTYLTGRDVTSMVVLTAVLSAEVKEESCTTLEAGADAVVGGVEAGLSQQCKAESAGHVAIAYKARPLAELLGSPAPAPVASAPPVSAITEPPVSARPRLGLAVPVATPADDQARELAEILTRYLGLSRAFRVLDPRSFLADPSMTDLGIDPPTWLSVGAGGVVKYRMDAESVAFSLYEPHRGAQVMRAGAYKRTLANAAIARKWALEVQRHFTGSDGPFGSRLALAISGPRPALRVIDFDGAGTKDPEMPTTAGSVAWSPRGDQIAWTRTGSGQQELMVSTVGLATLSATRRLSAFPGQNDEPSWSPDGESLAVVLSKDGDNEIYVLNARDGSIRTRLTNHPGNDRSPSWSSDGGSIAFVSDRDGDARLYVSSAAGGAARLVPTAGTVAGPAAWSPEPGRRVVAYAVSTGEQHDIVTHDLDAEQVTPVARGAEDERNPSFSPDGGALVYRRAGETESEVVVARADGNAPWVVYRGQVGAISWGPARTQP